MPSVDGFRQTALAQQFGVHVGVAHRALADVQTLAAIWPHLLTAGGASLDDIIASPSRCIGIVSELSAGGAARAGTKCLCQILLLLLNSEPPPAHARGLYSSSSSHTP